MPEKLGESITGFLRSAMACFTYREKLGYPVKGSAILFPSGIVTKNRHDLSQTGGI